jgi:hypothetical protein
MISPSSTYPIYGEQVSSKVYYSMNWFDYNIKKIDEIHVERHYFKNTNHYILSFIDHIKENIIKNCKDLNQVSIELLTFDSDNILHRLIISVSKFINEYLKKKHPISYNQSVFVVVTVESKIKFTGLIDFTGLD